MKVSYPFTHYETALTAYVGDVDKKLNQIIEDIPVFSNYTGDDTYFMGIKFEEAEQKEFYLSVPRCQISFGMETLDKSQDTAQNTTIVYNFKGENFQTTSTRKALNFSSELNIVCANYIMALRMLEVAHALFVRENVLTYEYLGNNYPLSYVIESSNIDKNESDSQSKNCTIKVGIVVQIQPFIIKPFSIKSLGESIIKGAMDLVANFNIVSRFGDKRTTTPPDHESNLNDDKYE